LETQVVLGAGRLFHLRIYPNQAEAYEPALADTLALLTNPQVEALLKQGDEAVQKGEMVPFDETLISQ
jgi:hypothetical protein